MWRDCDAMYHNKSLLWLHVRGGLTRVDFHIMDYLYFLGETWP